MNEQIDRFVEWLDAQVTPANYDRDALRDCALANACDVPDDQIAAVAIDTARQYLDDASMARDAGIVS